jgi:hypothetical protein
MAQRLSSRFLCFFGFCAAEWHITSLYTFLWYYHEGWHSVFPADFCVFSDFVLLNGILPPLNTLLWYFLTNHLTAAHHLVVVSGLESLKEEHCDGAQAASPAVVSMRRRFRLKGM